MATKKKPSEKVVKIVSVSYEIPLNEDLWSGSMRVSPSTFEEDGDYKVTLPCGDSYFFSKEDFKMIHEALVLILTE